VQGHGGVGAGDGDGEAGWWLEYDFAIPRHLQEKKDREKKQ
jgi:hypothetical protein